MMIKRRTETGTSGDTLADSAQGVTEGRGDDGLRCASPTLHELDAFKAALKGALKKGDMVTLLGFGSFYVGKRAARNGRNPQTGATIAIPAAQVTKFRSSKTRNKGGKFSPASALKDAVN